VRQLCRDGPQESTRLAHHQRPHRTQEEDGAEPWPATLRKLRRNELRDFFAAIVNAPPPNLPEALPLPPDTALPSQGDFDTQPVTSTDVVWFARKAPGGRATGPDEVPVESAANHEGRH
jgi:hypothetical protein